MHVCLAAYTAYIICFTMKTECGGWLTTCQSGTKQRKNIALTLNVWSVISWPVLILTVTTK